MASVRRASLTVTPVYPRTSSHATEIYGDATEPQCTQSNEAFYEVLQVEASETQASFFSTGFPLGNINTRKSSDRISSPAPTPHRIRQLAEDGERAKAKDGGRTSFGEPGCVSFGMTFSDQVSVFVRLQPSRKQQPSPRLEEGERLRCKRREERRKDAPVAESDRLPKVENKIQPSLSLATPSPHHTDATRIRRYT